MNDNLSTDMAGLLSSLDPLREDELARVMEMGRARGGARRIAATPWRRARPAAGRRVVGIAAALAVAACLAAVALVVSLASSPAPAAYALSFSQKDGYVEVRVLNPYASVAEVSREMAVNHLHVRLYLLPVPPGSVGQIIALESAGRNGGGVQPLQEGRCVNGPCTVGVKVARGFKGAGAVYIGRPARHGERYASTPIGGAFAPGEPLHCSGLQGAGVARVMPMLKRLGIKVIAWRSDRDGSWRKGADAPKSALVDEVVPVRSGEVELLLAAKPAPSHSALPRTASMSGCKSP